MARDSQMTLSQKQRLFCKFVGELITWGYEHGYEFTFGDAYRSPEAAAAMAAQGKGITRSLHTLRLAVDLNLFISGEYRSDTEAYRPLGDFWKSLSQPELDIRCTWGGDFSRPDGNHFSLEHEGVR